MKSIKKGSKVKYDGGIGKVDFIVNYPHIKESFGIDGHIAFVDFKSPTGNPYWKVIFVDELIRVS